VGKSSLLNALAGENRALVDAAPGTTRDPVDTRLQFGDHRVRVVDTAGMRRQVLIKDPLEYFSFLRSRRTLARVDAAVLVVDSADGVTSHDQRIAEAIVESGRACVIALNKWDLVPPEGTDRARLDRAIEKGLRFLPWATRVRVSALTTRGVDRLVVAIEQAIHAHRSRVPTAELNRILADVQQDRPASRVAGRAARILYGAQAGVSPPRVVLFATRRLDTAYVRFVERRLRTAAGFEGTPIKLEVRLRSRRDGTGS
jgi:GTPase